MMIWSGGVLMSVRVMTVGVMSVVEITVRVMTLGVMVSGRSGPKSFRTQVVSAQVDPAPGRFGPTINITL